MNAGPALLVCAALAFGQQPRTALSAQSPGEFDNSAAAGAKLAAEIERQATVVRDPIIVEYLDGIVQRLSAACAAGRLMRTSLIVSDDMNGFAMPGGFLFVNTGLIRKTDSEAELAGVLAYLIASASSDLLLRSGGSVGSFDTIPIVFMGGRTGHTYASDARLLVPAGFLEKYRRAVAADDKRGLRCLYAAGYAPAAFLEPLKKLQEAEGSSGSGSNPASTHPPIADRIAETQAIVNTLPPKSEYRLNTREFEIVKRLVDKPNASAAADIATQL